MNTSQRNRKQTGAVALFVVIFAMLIITVITVGFLRLMTKDQMQASNSDLSQSAYDSAQAGVEDAKRALLYYQETCNSNQAACGPLSAQISSDVCNNAILSTGVIGTGDVAGGSAGAPGEVKVQQSQTGSDTVLDQAYTCVKVALQTKDYIGKLAAGESQLVPMVGVSTFNTVTLRWFNRDDVTSNTGAVTLTPDKSSSAQRLMSKSDWGENRPSLMRAQLMQFGSSFTESDFDASKGGQGNAYTVFLYPTGTGGLKNTSFQERDARASTPGGSPLASSASTADLRIPPVACQSSVASGGFACSMSLQLPEPIGGGDRTAFLRITPFYNVTHFQVVLSNGIPNANGANVVKFKDVQPEVDSTGRANDLFRRVSSRVNLYDTSFPYPDATIDVTGNFCKDFSVTDTQYLAGACTP